MMLQLASWGGTRGIDPMIRINGHYLYEVGAQITPLGEIQAGMALDDAYIPLLVAEGGLRPFVFESVFKLKTSFQSGSELISRVKALKDRCENAFANGKAKQETVSQLDVYSLHNALNKFQAVVGAELNLSPIYLISQIGAYDTDRLVSGGEALFPGDLIMKVPEAIGDVQQATKCLAFELPTACGFHLHRANESVLHKWFDAVSNGAPRPKTRNIGDYLVELDKLKLGDKKVKSALKDLKDLHRNPLIHPEHSLETIFEAIALLGSIQAAVTMMLKDIPIEQPDPAPQVGEGGIVPARKTSP